GQVLEDDRAGRAGRLAVEGELAIADAVVHFAPEGPAVLAGAEIAVGDQLGAGRGVGREAVGDAGDDVGAVGDGDVVEPDGRQAIGRVGLDFEAHVVPGRVQYTLHAVSQRRRVGDHAEVAGHVLAPVGSAQG